MNEMAHIGQFAYCSVPVELADRALGQVLLGSRDVHGDGEVGDDLLPDPATAKDPRARVGEAPFQVRHHTVIGALLAQVVRVLQIERFVGAPYSFC